jgi:oligopeptide transport system permease protein
MARLMLAGRISLLVGALGSAVALTIGVSFGMISGYAGGKLDLVMMRAVDALYALPFIFFVILLTAFFGRRFLLIFVAIGAVEWLDMARLARGQTLSLKSREFVLAARALGVRSAVILARHIAPNIAGVVFAYLAVLAPRVILVESFLSFLGLGVREPLTSLGVLAAEGARHLQDAPWLLITPATLLMLMLYGFAFIGESAASRAR